MLHSSPPVESKDPYAWFKSKVEDDFAEMMKESPTAFEKGMAMVQGDGEVRTGFLLMHLNDEGSERGASSSSPCRSLGSR